MRIARTFFLKSFLQTFCYGLLVIGLLLGGARAYAESAYRVDIKDSGDADLDPLVKASSSLLSLEDTQYPGDFAFLARLRGDYGRIETAMQSRGYYAGQVTISVEFSEERVVDGRDPHLLDDLHEQNKAHHDPIKVEIRVERGTVFKIRQIAFFSPASDLSGQKLKSGNGDSAGRVWGAPVTLSSAASKAFGMVSGANAVSEDVLSAKDRLLHYLLESGHAEAKVDAPVAYVRPGAHAIDLKFTLVEGPVVAIGPIRFTGEKRTNISFLKSRIVLHQGQPYQPSRIEAARQDIVSTGLFSYVGVKNDPPLVAISNGESGRHQAMPIVFRLKEAKLRSVSAQAGYSTDLGGRAGVSWTHRNILGNAERLKLTALMTGLGGSAQQGLGYDFYADLLKPDFLHRQQNLSFRLEGVRQLLYSYHQTAVILRGGVIRKVGNRWNIGGGAFVEQEQIRQFGTLEDYFIAALPLSASYDSTDLDNPVEPATHGYRVNLSITPSESFEHGNSFFTIMSGSITHYYDFAQMGLSRPGRSVLALRGIIGSVQGASTYQIPPDQRLYAGGPATIRGFRYQGIGPQRGKYGVGGTSLDAGTVEFRQRVLDKFGVAAFVDAGQVGEGSRPFQGTVRVGYGAGVRYYTPIGPIRLDFALPVNRPQGGDKWEFYVGLGETF